MEACVKFLIAKIREENEENAKIFQLQKICFQYDDECKEISMELRNDFLEQSLIINKSSRFLRESSR